MFRGGEKVNSKIKMDDHVAEPYLTQYLHESVKELKKGDVVLAFHKYQFEALKDIFKEKLEYTYNAVENWWSCRLKGSE